MDASLQSRLGWPARHGKSAYVIFYGLHQGVILALAYLGSRWLVDAVSGETTRFSTALVLIILAFGSAAGLLTGWWTWRRAEKDARRERRVIEEMTASTVRGQETEV